MYCHLFYGSQCICLSNATTDLTISRFLQCKWWIFVCHNMVHVFVQFRRPANKTTAQWLQPKCNKVPVLILSSIYLINVYLMMNVYNECEICDDPCKPCTGTPDTRHPRKVWLGSTYWLNELLQLRNSLFLLCKMHNSKMAPRKWHFIVYWALSQHFGWPLYEFNAGVWWLG